jgi:hypothetical protein
MSTLTRVALSAPRDSALVPHPVPPFIALNEPSHVSAFRFLLIHASPVAQTWSCVIAQEREYVPAVLAQVQLTTVVL